MYYVMEKNPIADPGKKEGDGKIAQARKLGRQHHTSKMPCHSHQSTLEYQVPNA
jgi:hypothetical protein